MNRLIILAISLFSLNHCSFNENSRIWKDKDQKIDNPKDIKKVFSEDKKITLELNQEIKNLIIYKKALYNADQAKEGDLLNMLNPLINSQSVWKSHALYLIAEYFYSKDQKQKSKEFFNQIISMEDPNSDIRLQAQKRLNRDLSE